MAETANGLPYPVGTDLVTNGDDAIRALAETIDALTLVGPNTYTPGLTNITLGNGSIAGRWWVNGRHLLGDVVVTWGSTTTSSAPMFVQMPPSPLVPPPPATTNVVGTWSAFDTSASAIRAGFMIRSGSNASVRNPDGSGVGGATNPWTWAAGDQLLISWAYPIPYLLGETFVAGGGESLPAVDESNAEEVEP